MNTANEQILVADDDPIIRQILKFHLVRNGYSVVLACDGEEAVRLMNEGIQAVLLDVNMPKLNGIECLGKIKERFPNVQVIIMSAQSKNKDAPSAINYGAMKYLNKPVDLDELLSLIKKAIDLRNG